MLQELLKILSEKGLEHTVVAACFVIVFFVIGFLVKEHAEQKKEIKELHKEKDQLNKEKLEMADEMLDMANDYNKEMVTLQRETSSTITIIMSTLSLINNKKEN